MSNSIVDLVANLRQQICPRTSYASSGRAASVLVAVTDTENRPIFEQFGQSLLKTKEFESIDNMLKPENLLTQPPGGVLIFFNMYTINTVQLSKQLLMDGKYKLVFFISTYLDSNADLSSKRYFNKDDSFLLTLQHTTISSWEILACFKQRSTSTTNTSTSTSLTSFNKQPSVASTKQFRYLWSRECPLQMGYDNGKERVLQRLADKALHNTADQKLTTSQWDSIIKQSLESGSNNFDIYSLIRQKALGSSLSHDLQVISDAASSAKKGESSGGGEDGGGDGRAMHMVNMTAECIPSHLRGITGSDFTVCAVLDYGCAEGAITAELGRKLGLPANKVFGADVRSIPSDGFTFVPLSAEDDRSVPAVGSILPSLQSGSVDLVTAAMVFHHVTHISSILLELRRVISSRGVLILREHHCTSPDGAAFLDIIHGLYSLAWSSPVEWPDFLAEYKAFYRSREEWTALVTAAGFIHVPRPNDQGARHYRSAESSVMKPNGWIPNVIKAYYGVYAPDPNFKFPVETVRVQPTVVSSGDSSGVHHKTAGGGDDESAQRDRKRPRVEEAPPAMEEQLFESSKYPGQFYRINKQTGATEWV